MLRITLAILFICIFSNLNSQDYKDIQVYNKDDNQAFDLLDHSLDGKKYFFSGENHIYQKSNYLIQYKLTEYLHRKVGLNKILLEFGPGTGWLINQFILTGDSLYFTELKKFFSIENLSLYIDLHELNKNYPENQISCHGIDLERFPQISISSLILMLPQKAPQSDSLNVSVETLRAIYSVAAEYSYQDFYASSGFQPSEIEISTSFNLWLSEYAHLKKEYEIYLGVNFKEFNRTIEGLKAGKVWSHLKNKKALQETIYREQYMYNTLKYLDKEYPNSKFYGQFGVCHIRTDNASSHCYSYAMKSLIYKINENDFKDELMILPIFYVRNVFLKDKKYLESSLNNFWGMDESVFLMKVPQDVQISNEFKSESKFIFVNNLKLTKDQITTDPYRTEREKKKIPTLRFSSEVEMGISYFKYNELNSFMNLKGLSGFKNPTVTVGGSFSVFSPYGFYYGMQFAIGLSQSAETDSVSVKLSNYNVLVNIGTSILNTSWFSFNPTIGIGGGNFSLKETRTIPDPNSMNLFSENNQNYTIYKNPNFLIDLKTEFKFNVNIFSFSIKGGYLFDVTNKHWRSTDILPNSPKTAMMGWHVKAGLGINLKVY